MTKETEDLTKAINLGQQAVEELQKSHINQYTRKDGTLVKEHDDSRQAHPSIIGQAEKVDKYRATMQHDGKRYLATNKSGKSMHDGRHVDEFEDKSGHRVWLDMDNNVHADSKEEADKHHKRGMYYTEHDDKQASKQMLSSKNTSNGFHGAGEDVVWRHAKESGGYDGQTKEHEAMHKKIWDEASKHIQKVTGAEAEDVRNYLDSTNGRHLADQVHDEIHVRGKAPKDPDKESVQPKVFHEHIKHAVNTMEKKWPGYINKRMAEIKKYRHEF